MDDYISRNKAAWEYDAYRFWVRENGAPCERAKRDIENPLKALRRFARYFEAYEGVRVANICGSCGKKAIPLALLGAKVTVFDISEANARYALETAEAAHTHIEYVVGNVLDIDMSAYGEAFSVVFMEGGILHYFHDIDRFLHVIAALLPSGGTMILSDFHPLQKIYDGLGIGRFSESYFSTEVVEGEMAHARFYPEEIRRSFPRCSYRRYTLSEIINAVISAGFAIRRFDEYPAWKDEKVPGEFVIVGEKE